MANFDELYEVVLEAEISDNYSLINDMTDKVKSIKNDIKIAKKEKDIEKMEKISEEIDEIIDMIENYRKTEVDYDNFINIDKVINAVSIATTVLKALAVAIPIGILTKGTIDGINGMKNGTIISEREADYLGLKSYAKKNNGTKVASMASSAAAVTAMATTELKDSDRRKMRGSFDNVMKELKDIIDKLKKMNNSLKKDIQKNKNKLKDSSVKESADAIKLEIYESCYNGEITEEERDILLDMM